MVEGTPSPTEAPPPAYEIAQFDFDQKLAVAAERSLHISDDASAHENEEPSDEVRGADPNASRSSRPHPSICVSGHQQTVQPLSFRKKSRSSNSLDASSKVKERPSWFSEAQLDASSSGRGVSSRALPVPTGRHLHNDRSAQHVISEDSDEDRSLPPPPFVVIDNSLDGPAYERYATNDARRRRTGGTVVLRYTGGNPSVSPPPSPPHSPVIRHARQQPNLQVRTSLPRPRSAGPQRYVPPPPRMSFDPSVAYEGTKSSLYGQLPTDTEETNHDASALYNSAVAPHLTSQKPRPSAAKVMRYAPSISSLPEYEQQQQYQSIHSGKPLYAVQDYATSRASVYSQNSVNQIPQYPQVAQYPQMAQYPVQQSYARPTSFAQQGDSQRWSTASDYYQTQYYPR